VPGVPGIPGIPGVPGVPGFGFGVPVKTHPKKKPRVEMKGLFWDKIQDNKIKGTIWEKLDDTKINLNLDTFEEKFAMKQKAPVVKKEEPKKVEKKKKYH
jgi:diaphanous 1